MRKRAGRTRIKMAEMLKEQHGIDIDPDDLFTNNTPAYRLADCCRWGGDGTKDGRHVHVCSWSTMTEIIKQGTIAVVDDSYLTFEVCEGPATYKTEFD